MNSRLLTIVLVQILAILLWGLYAEHRLAHMEFVGKQYAVANFNCGVDAMAAGTFNTGLIRTDKQAGRLHEVQESLWKADTSWTGLDYQMVNLLLAIPAAGLSLLAIVALLLESRSRHKNRDGLETTERSRPCAVDF